MGRPVPARRCWPRPWPTNRARTSSRSRPRRSWRCSPAWAPRASVACSVRRAPRSPRSSSSTSSTPSARAAARTTTQSASRRSTSCWSRWTASPPPRRAGWSSWPPPTCSRSSTRRCCAPGASTARSSSRRRTSGPRQILRVHTPTSRCATTSTSRRGPADGRPHRRRPGQHLQRGGDLLRAPGGRRRVAADFDDAIERVIAGVLSSTTLNDHERKVVAFHEAGHALTRELLEGMDRVHKISIVPRGSALGYVVNLPDEDSYLKTREELVDQMTVLLGGRVAEQIVFGAVTTGAANDLQRVEEITHAMVHEYAMGTGDAPQAALTDQALSDLTRRIRDEEQHELAFEAQRAARELITAHRESSTASPPSCSSTRRSSAPQIDRIMDGVPPIGGAGPCRTCASRRRRSTRRRPTDSRPGCSPGSTTSASPSRTSTPPSPCTKRPTAWPSCTARSSRSRGSRPCCSTSARTTSSCCARSRGHARRQVPVQARPGPAPRRLPGADVQAALQRCAPRPAAHRRDAAHRHPRLARRLPAPRLVAAACSPRSSSPRRDTDTMPSASASASRPAPRSPCA